MAIPLRPHEKERKRSRVLLCSNRENQDVGGKKVLRRQPALKSSIGYKGAHRFLTKVYVATQENYRFPPFG
jgi:hypothetical protein